MSEPTITVRVAPSVIAQDEAIRAAEDAEAVRVALAAVGPGYGIEPEDVCAD